MKIKKIINYITHPKKILIYLMDRNFFFFIPDKIYLKWKFKLIMGYKLDLDNPQTFNEKLQWLKLYDRKDLYTKMVDKYEAKEYVKKIIGDEYIIKTYGVYDSYDEIDFSKLPNEFVMKPTHTSGDVYICTNKKEIDHKKLKKKVNKWLKRNYYMMHREWPYKNVKPRIIIEKYMEDKKYNELIDYKVMCFNCKAKMVFTCSERFSKKLKVTFFDLNWKKLPFERHYPASSEKIKKPINLELMLKLSEKLSKNIPFLRVDFYEINNKLYFGELTFYPGSGYEEFNSADWDYKIGNMINIEKRK